MKTLDQLKPGESATIHSINAPEAVVLKLLELGIAPGETIRFCRRAPLGDPIEIELLDYRLALRCSEASRILLTSA